jgi:hypothetical protein
MFMQNLKAICIVIRGELLRNPTSTFHDGNNTKEIKPYTLDPIVFHKQNQIMESILNHIVKPYKYHGYHVHVSGCVYECPTYESQLNKYFPNNTILQIPLGHTNQAHLFANALEQAENKHPECIEYIILRADYLMLRDVKIINTPTDFYTGFAWKNLNGFPQVDVFFIISKKAMCGFKSILYKRIHLQHCDTHYILEKLKQLVENNKRILLYPIWDDYQNGATGLSFPKYEKEYHLHTKRPFVNYIREVRL